MRNLSALMLKMFYPRTIRKQLKACWNNFTSFIESKGFKVTDCFPGTNKLIAFDGNGNPEIIKRKNGFQLFQEIVSRTQTYRNGSYDYAGLGKKIELYEVNGFMKESELKEYKRTVSYISKANYIIASIVFAFGLITWFVV